jgi:predicted kinase/transcriptional regulator with XRE-family HTH domain
VPSRLRERRETHGLSLEAVGEALCDVAVRNGLAPIAANFQTVWQHENGKAYPGPHYRRAYCLLYGETEYELGFRNPLPAERHGALTGSPQDDGETIRSALAGMIATAESSTDLHARLVDRVVTSWTRGRAAIPDEHGPTLVLVAGFAGSGKTELACFLSAVTGWALLDKDQLTRPLVERLLITLGLDANDRHSADYWQHVRPLEYRCLLDTAFENLDRGVSVVVTAPLLDELRDSDWLQRVAHRCSARRAQLIPLWVRCDAGSMHDHLAIRGAGRDTWKLSNWHDYLASMDLGMRPRGEHIVIDNTLGAAVGVADLTRLRLQVPVALP